MQGEDVFMCMFACATHKLARDMTKEDIATLSSWADKD